MTDDDLLALRAPLGEAGLCQHAPVDVEGVKLGTTLEPQDGEALAGAVRVLCERGLAVLVRGGGSRLGLANPVTRADAVLSTARLEGIEHLDAEEGVVHVRAGTPLSTLRDAVRGAGWELPLDPPGRATTVGGAIACAALGPRALGFGLVRDVVLGLGMVLGSGERTRCGGRVVKNVTGYDLQKLYAGSFGTLGVIESAWLRLRPFPERVELLAATHSPADGELVNAIVAARGPATRVAAWLDASLAKRLAATGDATPGPLLLIELAGGDPVVEARARELRDELGATPASSQLLRDVRDFQQGAAASGALRMRVSALASRLPAAAEVLLESGAELAAHPGLGLLYAGFGGSPQQAVAAARESARRAGGGWRIESAPLDARREFEVFGETPPAFPVMRALKAAYDPAGVLNPGRFLGGL
jgi:glycolate oxidase FAD binding subunit